MPATLNRLYCYLAFYTVQIKVQTRYLEKKKTYLSPVDSFHRDTRSFLLNWMLQLSSVNLCTILMRSSNIIPPSDRLWYIQVLIDSLESFLANTGPFDRLFALDRQRLLVVALDKASGILCRLFVQLLFNGFCLSCEACLSLDEWVI